MGEFEEFAEALMGQLEVELNEEKEIAELSSKIKEDNLFTLKFDEIEKITQKIFPELKKSLEDFIGLPISENLAMEFPGLKEFKEFKGKKVFASEDSRSFVDELFQAVANENRQKIVELIKKDTPKYLVYSTYAIQYISKLTTTYGDYLDSSIYLNKFILSNYPKIILYKQGPPYESKYEMVNSGYLGALKMTLLEEQIHSIQDNLQKINKTAAREVNSINEELAKIILSLDNEKVAKLSEYLQLQTVPEDFPFAKKANLFFFLNPDHFLIEQIGPDVMTFSKVEIDPKILDLVPQLEDIYQRWLDPIQRHHAAFTIMEGMAEFLVQNILKDDFDFQKYLVTFMGTDLSSYRVRKSLGKDFTKIVFEKLGKATFAKLNDVPPSTRELKDPKLYLQRIQKN